MNYTYREIILNGIVECIERSDGAMIPLSESNSDYQRYLRWLENPNADEFQPPLEG